MSENLSELASTPPPRRSKGSSTKKRLPPLLSWLVEIGTVLVLALIVSTLLRQFVVQVFSIPSGSMEQTMQIGDRIVANRLPVIGKQIERGDVIVFRDTQGWLPPVTENSSALRSVGEFLGIVPDRGDQVLVKRVIGLGGDTVTCSAVEGLLQINGQAITEDYLYPGDGHCQSDFSVTVPDGAFWVMGDHRSNSGDSRLHLSQGTGYINEDDVIGKVSWIAWPLNHWSSVAHREAFADVPDPS